MVVFNFFEPVSIVRLITRISFATILKACSLEVFLFVLLFGSGISQSSPGFVGSALREIAVVFHDAETQWMAFLCLGIYFSAFLFLHLHLENELSLRLNTAKSSWCLFYLFCVSAAHYVSSGSQSIQALTFLGGAVIGRSASFGGVNTKLISLLTFYVPLSFVLLLMSASVWNSHLGYFYQYKSHVRSTGPWDNPNLYGLLMGTGVILMSGFFVLGSSDKTAFCAYHRLSVRFLIAILCLAGFCLMTWGLFQSYSRGAWLSAGCGGSYLIGFWLLYLLAVRRAKPSFINCLFDLSRVFVRNWLLMVVVSVATGSLFFWNFQHTDWHPVRRAVSSVDQVDFSWRNRVVAWKGAFQIMVKHPWFGSSWQQTEPLYEHYYLPPKLHESAGIEMNDYLMLGATLGIPALFCFGMYGWLSLGGGQCQNLNFKFLNCEEQWLKATCRAAAIVLLVGFWFDGGLFKLPTAATFWILLELGRDDVGIANGKITVNPIRVKP